MRLLNMLNRFKKLSLSQRIETRFSIITFTSKIRLCSWCERHHLIKSLFYFICSLLEHAIQRIHFKTSVYDSRSRRQSSQTYLIFWVIRDFDNKSRKKCFLFILVNVLSKIFYSVDLRIFLFKLEIIFNKMFFLVTIVITFVVF